MKVFNGRGATDEYMSTHSLTFSTPEMTLKKFALWLGEPIRTAGSEERVPRLMLYLKDNDTQTNATKLSELTPDTDDTFRPSGAVTDMYSSGQYSTHVSKGAPKQNPNSYRNTEVERFCFDCGFKLKAGSKFCRNCGTKQANHEK